jgi:hypothetical protein
MHPRTKLLLSCTLCLPLAATAQNVLAPTPSAPVVSPFLQDLHSGPFPESADSVLMTMLGLKPYQLGPVAVHPHATYRVSYADGIESQPGQPLSSVINEFSPGLLFNVGNHTTVDYTPTWTFYSNDRLRDSLDHSLRLSWGTSYRDWLFSLSHAYQVSSSSRVETATQTDQQTQSTSISAFYQVNGSLNAEFDGDQQIRVTDQFTTVYSWSSMNWLNYNLGSRFSFGIGAGGTFNDVSPGVDMRIMDYQARASWIPTEKLSFSINGGGEDVHFQGANLPDLISPTFGASIGYRPFKDTGISLTASRSVQASYFQNQATEFTSVSTTLNQQLLKHFSASISGSYSTSQYVAAARGVASGRHDDYYSLSARLSWLLLRQFSMSLFYHYSDNGSSQSAFGYSSSQTGLEVGYRL